MVESSGGHGLGAAELLLIQDALYSAAEPAAPQTPETESRATPFTLATAVCQQLAEEDIPAGVGWPVPAADAPGCKDTAFELSSENAPLQHGPTHQRHHHSTSSTSGDSSSKASRKHRHEAAGSSSMGSTAESLTGRSHSYSSGYTCASGSSSSSSATGHAASCHEACGNRPKSFTVGQLQAHKHRLAASTTPARSASPPAGPTHHTEACCAHRRTCYKCGPTRQRPASAAAFTAAGGGPAGLRSQGSGSSVGSGYKPLAGAYSGGAYCSSGGSLPQRGLLMAESVFVQDIGKGFKAHWYSSHRVLQVFDGSMPADPQVLLRQVPQQPGLHLWLVKPPCSRQWVPVRLDAAQNLQQVLAACLHADGSCGPPGSKQRVLLDLQCRGFAVQVRYRPAKASCGSLQQDLLSKLQRFDFALNDTDNNGCRPIELPDGRPVFSYPLVVGHMMRLFEQLFVQPRLM